MRRTGTSLALVAATMIVAGCGGSQLAKEAISDPGQMIFNAHVNPEATCWTCHNGNGGGSFWGPRLIGRQKLTEEKVVRQIHDGKGRMPPFKGKLTDDEMRKVAAWVLSIAAKP